MIRSSGTYLMLPLQIMLMFIVKMEYELLGIAMASKQQMDLVESSFLLVINVTLLYVIVNTNKI